MKRLISCIILIFVLVGCKFSYHETLPTLSDSYQDRITNLKAQIPLHSYMFGCRLDTLRQFSDLNLQLKVLYPNAKVFYINVDHLLFFLERKEGLLQSKSLFFSYQLGDSGLSYDIKEASRFVDFDVTKVSFEMDRIDNLHYYIIMKDNSANGM